MQSTLGQFLCGGGARGAAQQWHVSVAARAPASAAGTPSGVIASRESNTNRWSSQRCCAGDFSSSAASESDASDDTSDSIADSDAARPFSPSPLPYSSKYAWTPPSSVYTSAYPCSLRTVEYTSHRMPPVQYIMIGVDLSTPASGPAPSSTFVSTVSLKLSCTGRAAPRK